MKKIVFILFLLVSNLLIGQNYGNNWCFGDNLLLDFSTCAPIVSSSSNNGFEGCSTVSDSSGNLLFYTNGYTIWDASHNPMQNSPPTIFGGTTISQCLIVQKPQSNKDYFVFVPGVQAQSASNFIYHEIDINQNGGLGSITNATITINSNSITEQVAATMHSNGTDIWIMTHEYGTNIFSAYLMTSTGLNLTPTISSVGSNHLPAISNMNARGNIKFSPDGNKIAFNGNGTGPIDTNSILEIFDFDNSSGQVSNSLKLPYMGGEFGLSFSPDNSKLYCGTWKALLFNAADSNYIYQFDLSSNDSLTIVNSRTIIYAISFGLFGNLKIGPDGKIYIAKNNSSYLSIINNPNNSGIACNYLDSGVYLNGNLCKYGLNNYIEYTNYCTTVNIEEENRKLEILIYPNPTSTHFIVEGLTQTYNLTIYNAVGQTLYKENINEDNTKVDVNSYPKGILFIRIEAEGNVIYRKVIKQ